LLGHNRVLDLFAQDMPKVLILKGQDGIGKFLLAEEIAKKFSTGCDLIITRETLKIDAVRNLIGFSKFIPVSSRYKVIVWDTDTFTNLVFNALLKLLEESQDRCKFILVSSKDNLPQTILSRSHVCNVESLPVNLVVDILLSKGVLESLAERVSKRCGGSISIALKLLDGIKERETVLSVVNFCCLGDLEICIKNTENWSDESMLLFEQIFRHEQARRMGIDLGYVDKYEECAALHNLSLDKLQLVLQICEKEFKSSIKVLLCCYALKV